MLPDRTPGSATRAYDLGGDAWRSASPTVQLHLHRYRFGADLGAGKRILDIAVHGLGGGVILASRAREVVVIDHDDVRVERARRTEIAPNLRFEVVSPLELGAFHEPPFDLVTCFGLLETSDRVDELLDGIEQLLAPGGIVLCSAAPGRVPPQLAERFSHRRAWGQILVSGSQLIAPEDSGASPVGPPAFMVTGPDGRDWRGLERPEPDSILVLAGGAELPALAPPATLVEPIASLATAADVAEISPSAQIEIAAARAEAVTLRAAVRESRAYSDYLWDEIVVAHKKLRHLETLSTWRLFELARGLLLRPDGSRNVVGRLFSLAAGKLLKAPSREPLPQSPAEHVWPDELGDLAALALHESPRASIVIPVHNQPQVTLACLRAIAQNTADVAYEVIVVDDASDAPTQAMLRRVAGLCTVRNESNAGYLRSTNRGIAQARGEYVVLLNNDTEVRPGWLSALVALADRDPTIGAVGAKLLFPDGVIQEAGAILWSDGTARHVGRGAAGDTPGLDHVREVDYCSAACLLVRGSALRELGGLDERYVPAYYEDVDLCFGLRALGLRVVYQPEATVVHHEGTSHGTDITSQAKAHQTRNQVTFEARWEQELRMQQPPTGHDARQAMDRRAGPRVLVVDHRVPTPDQDAGSLRMHELLCALDDMGCVVTLVPADRRALEPYATELRRRGIEVMLEDLEGRAMLEDLAPLLDLAILSRPTTAWNYLPLLRERAPRAQVVYDTVDLHHLREDRRAAAGDGVAGLGPMFRELELGLVRACDRTIAVSAEERDAVLREVPGADVVIIPTLNRVAAEPATPAGRRGLMFLGGFDHSPNVDAALHLVRDVLPLVTAELGEIPVRIVGSNPPPAVEALAQVPGVEITGFVRDLTQLLGSTRVMVAPLTYGAGVKGKITQSLAEGLPVVTTSVGLEGLGAQPGRDLLLADDPQAFAAAIVALYRDDDLWRRISAAGRGLAAARFAPESARDVLAELLAGTMTAPAREPALGVSTLSG